jgi:hypothetical protein
MAKHLMFPECMVLVGCCLVLTSGCAVHYYEEASGVEHIWGFGHMKMKASKPTESLQAVLHGSDVLGASIGKADKHAYITVGWQRLEYIDILQESVSIRLEWPDSTFANVRVGSRFPFAEDKSATTHTEKRP